MMSYEAQTFEVLFEPGAGMAAIAKQPSLWRSAFYFTLSFSFFGVATNCWLLDSPLEVRFGIIIATVLIAGTALTLYGFCCTALWKPSVRWQATLSAHLPFGVYDAAVFAAHTGGLACGQDGA